MTNHTPVSDVRERPINSWAVAGFVLSLFGWISPTIAIISGILAIIALNQINQHGERGRAMAEFARAFTIILLIVMLLRGGHSDWMAFVSQYPLWPR